MVRLDLGVLVGGSSSMMNGDVRRIRHALTSHSADFSELLRDRSRSRSRSKMSFRLVGDESKKSVSNTT